MTDWEHKVLNRIIEEKSLKEVLDLGLQSKHFLDPTLRRVYNRILERNREYGAVPSVAIMKREFPNLMLMREPETTLEIVEIIKKNYTVSYMDRSVGDLVKYLDVGDVKGLQQVMAECLKEVSAMDTPARDTNLRGSGQERLEYYQMLADHKEDLAGVPSGFSKLDSATQGFKCGQLVTLVGPPKAGKSTLALLCARAAYLQGVRVLFIGFEMSNEEQASRFDAFNANISHKLLTSGELSAADMKRLERAVTDIDDDPIDFILSTDTNSVMTLSGVQAKIEKYMPDIVFVDGVYMMQDENGEKPGSWQALTNITRGFKRMAQNMNLPIIISTQVLESKMDAKRGIMSSSIGYSSSFAQDSDLVLGVERTDSPSLQKLKVVLGRNVPIGIEVWVEWDWDHGTFKELDGDPADSTYSGDDIDKDYNNGFLKTGTSQY